jgi:hypothetical protein
MAVSKLSIKAVGDLAAAIVDGTTLARRQLRFGGLSIPALSVSLGYGTGSGQANWMYTATRTVAATTADNLDLAGSLTDGLGNTITATKLKLAVVAISSPDGTKSLRVGPRGVSNATLAGFGDASDYQTVRNWWVQYDPVGGYDVTAGTADLFCLYNPGAGSVTYTVLLAGV